MDRHPQESPQEQHQRAPVIEESVAHSGVVPERSLRHTASPRYGVRARAALDRVDKARFLRDAHGQTADPDAVERGTTLQERVGRRLDGGAPVAPDTGAPRPPAARHQQPQDEVGEGTLPRGRGEGRGVATVHITLLGTEHHGRRAQAPFKATLEDQELGWAIRGPLQAPLRPDLHRCKRALERDVSDVDVCADTELDVDAPGSPALLGSSNPAVQQQTRMECRRAEVAPRPYEDLPQLRSCTAQALYEVMHQVNASDAVQATVLH